MDVYEQIEEHFAAAYNATTTTRKAIGDFMLNDHHAVNVKSNNVHKANYSPNMISIRVLHEWVFREKKELSFIFVDYEETPDGGYKILNQTGLIPLHHISWDCLTIEAQGFGVIQKSKPLKIDPNQTVREFYEGMMREYKRYRDKEERKHQKFSGTFISDLDSLGPIRTIAAESAPKFGPESKSDVGAQKPSIAAGKSGDGLSH